MPSSLWLRRCLHARKRRFLTTMVTLLTTCIVLQSLSTYNSRPVLKETYPPVRNFWEIQVRPSPTKDKSSNVRVPTMDYNCTPKTHLVFLKTHKTGSSTILNILYRYGEKNNLKFAFPNYRFNQLSYPRLFKAKMVYKYANKSLPKLDIICNHMRFNKSEVEKIMPADSFYFSILRHPATMLESIFSYYKSFSIFKTSKNLGDFFNDSLSNYSTAAFHNNYAHNNLAFDFGFNNTLTADSKDLEENVSKAIKSIEQNFHLILINEHFDESIILLKHALCWSLEEVVSFKLNSRTNKTRRSISPETMEKVKLWNVLDWRLYQHFNDTFWHKVDTVFGREEMKRQVSQLRELRAKKASECLKDGQAVNPSKIKDVMLKPFQYGQAVIEGYLLNPQLSNHSRDQCLRLIMPELQYTYYLYDQQVPKKSIKDKKLIKDKRLIKYKHNKPQQKDKHNKPQQKDKDNKPQQKEKDKPQQKVNRPA
ncbi:galactose-3-O-sulfotransferase 2-like [Gouania willdenowi]|uniref:Galactose-3-O-sulfotransferase 2-like n=1 Tax=Gouania willdenowi TaxID=441366 RepID=A0A8C5G2L2_GOUWI|nr:galactose-3-O-sulfotransferase 2-like [Gouania willdenowi]